MQKGRFLNKCVQSVPWLDHTDATGVLSGSCLSTLFAHPLAEELNVVFWSLLWSTWKTDLQTGLNRGNGWRTLKCRILLGLSWCLGGSWIIFKTLLLREASHGVGPNEGQTSPASDFSEELAFKLMTWTYVDVVYIPLNDVINGTYIFLWNGSKKWWQQEIEWR